MKQNRNPRKSTQGTRDFYGHDEDFNTAEREFPPSACEICGKSIPPTKTKCKEHEGKSPTSDENEDGIFEWRISHVGFAIVEGKTDYHGMAIGASAFNLSELVQSEDYEYTPLSDLNNSPSKTLSRKWNIELEGIISLGSEKGQSLLDELRKKIRAGKVDNASNLLFKENGEAITANNLNEISTLLAEHTNECVWFVPAILKAKQVNTSNREVKYMECNNCGKQKHAHLTTKKFVDKKNEKTWICLNCHQKTTTGKEENYHEQVITTEEGHHATDVEYKNARENIER